jgi:UDP-N-acetylglucosamine 2-epimerase (non-hydrolysing)
MADQRMKVMVIVGTRPEVIKLSRTIAELDIQFRLVLVHTGQNFDYELNEIFFQELGLRAPDHRLEVAADTLAQTLGNILARCDRVLEAEKPDALLVLGDTNSCLAALCAKRRQIPIFHMEAGNRCFDQRVPEEINRKIVDHLSDINLPYTEHARRYLLAEGLRPETVIKTGSPMFEVLAHYRPAIDASDVLARLGLEPGRFFLVSSHREENVDSPASLRALLDSLNAVARQYALPIIFSTHARTRKRLEALADAPRADPLCQFLKPLGFVDYVQLQRHAFCVLSDSGTITEESSILSFPAITLRQAHERPEGMDEGTLVMSGLSAPRVLEAIRLVTAQQVGPERRFRLAADYAADNVSKKVARIIASYVDYVNRTVWFKDQA